MDTNQSDPKVSETDSVAVGDQPDERDRSETEITTTEAGDATSSHRPANAEKVPIEPEKDEEEYILSRELDGRYRIVGRRPRKED